MKLDYLDAESPNLPVIRLSDFTIAEAAELLANVQQMATAATATIEIHQLPFVQSIAGCQLKFCLNPWDQAVVRQSTFANEFECRFTSQTWDNISMLIEPFLKSVEGFQWLATVPGEAAILLSASGRW